MSIAISHEPATAVNSAIQLSNLRAHVNSEVIQKHYYTRSLNSHALAVPQFRTLSRQHSFFPSTITMWNELPSYVFEDSTSDSSINTFDNFKSNIISTLF